MFYLKYRPQNLAEIDNSAVRDTISNILKSTQIPHAFLFIGQKGMGKTSVARIMAQTLNKLPPGQTSSGDIVEMDAASNRGIEEIKALIKEASYVPMSGAYRVFIIDEAHMITPEAFNALLKTLEEPPSSAVFILATTNVEKLPKTIQSRCVVVNFGRAKKDDIIAMIKRIAHGEQITVPDETIHLIVAHADNSFRDAAKLFEELVIQKKLDGKEASEFLGIVGKKSLLSIIATQNVRQALEWVNEFVAGGGNIKYLLETTLDDLRVLLLTKNGVVIEDTVADINLSAADITRLARLLTDAYNMLKISPSEALALEIAVADFYSHSQTKKG